MPFATAFFLTVILIWLLKFFLGKLEYAGRISDRHIGGKKYFRLGGVAIVSAFNLAIFLNPDLVISIQLWGIIFASWMILIMGIWDDLQEISWKVQLFFQSLATMMIFLFGVRISGLRIPFTDSMLVFESNLGILVSLMIMLVWIIIIINSLNWLDGIDGLAGGVFLIGATTIFVLSLRPEVNQPPMAILAMILAGSALGFLVFNFHPSIVIAGTSGSMFMGFILAAMAIFAGTKVATAILVLSLPIIDFIWVIGERIRRKKSIFEADKNHLHHKLLELGWSQRKITLYFYGTTALIAVVALNTRPIGKSIAFAAIFIGVASVSLLLNKKLKKT